MGTSEVMEVTVDMQSRPVPGSRACCPTPVDSDQEQEEVGWEDTTRSEDQVLEGEPVGVD